MKSIIEHKLLALGFFFVLAGSLQAIPRTWDGGGLDGSFLNAVNWNGDLTIPISNVDTLQVGVNTAGGTLAIGFDIGAEFRTPSFTFLASAASSYTVTTNSVDNFLTLTGTGVTMQNSSSIRQEFLLIKTNVAAVTQTWDGGAQGLILSQIDLGNDHVLTFDGTGTSASTRNEIRGGITGTATSGVTKIGAGTLLFNTNDVSDYTGKTTLSGGRLQLGRKNQIPDASKLVLNNGTFDTGGFSDTLAALILGGTATIDFETSAVDLIFGASSGETWTAGTLNILNFTPGTDTLRFGLNGSGLSQSQLNKISFNGMQAGITSTGFLFPIPEPGVPAMILSGLAVLGSCRRHRDRRATA